MATMSGNASADWHRAQSNGRGGAAARLRGKGTIPPGMRAVLDAGERVFLSKGYGATVVSDIIAESGGARGTFYLYFTGKADVFLALVEFLIQELRDALVGVKLGEEYSNPFLQFRERFRSVLEVVAREPGKTRLLLSYPVGTDAQVDAVVGDFMDTFAVQVRKAIGMAYHLGFARPGDRDITSALVVGSIKEVMLKWTYEGPEPDPALLERYAENIFRYVVSGTLREGAVPNTERPNSE